MRRAARTVCTLVFSAIVMAESLPANAQFVPTVALDGGLLQYTNFSDPTTESPLYTNHQNCTDVASASCTWATSGTTNALCSGFGATASGSTIVNNGSLGASVTMAMTIKSGG